MKSRRNGLVPAFGVGLSILFASALFAQRSFVSAVTGDDTHSCSRSAPCRSFATAIAAVGAGGEVVVLDSGGYGPVNITKSITIESPSGIYAGIAAMTGDGITINAGSNDLVVLRGLVLNGGPADGITVNSVGILHIENCIVGGFASIGIWYGAPNSSFFVKDTISRRNDDGILMFDGKVSIDHCRFEANKLIGVNVDGADVTVRDSVSTGNLFDGFSVGSLGLENSVLQAINCVSASNGRDGFSSSKMGTGSVTARLASCAVTENAAVGLHVDTGVVFESLGNNLVRGNSPNTSGSVVIVSGK